MLVITNTLTGVKEKFEPRNSGHVTMYVCGVTPYDYAHLGHGRVYVLFDVLYRLLQFMGYQVTYCRNFTDIDDKLINKAEAIYHDPLQFARVAQTYIDYFSQDMKQLNCLLPTHEPRVTENIPEIINFVEQLIAKGHAYVVNGDVYFSVDTFAHYAQLSKHKLTDLDAGNRVKTRDEKKNPLDFALWKSEKESTFWQSPWGYGRPGWHIECSALAKKYLGEQIDIHGGGMDLIFPHHDNEIAQTESLTGKQFARYWMHNAFVQVNKEKMSKSLGNFLTLRDVFAQFDPMVIRLYYLNHHYKTPLDFAEQDLIATEKMYQKLIKLCSDACTQAIVPTQQFKQLPLINEMLQHLYNDLNTAGAIGLIFAHMNEIEQDQKLTCAVKEFLQQLLGLTLAPIAAKETTITPEIQQLLDEREQARLQKNWQRADQLRTQLEQMGVNVQDKKIK